MTLLHVFDLPQLYTKPSPQDLLEALSLLETKPPSWESSDIQEGKGGSPQLESRDKIRVSDEGITGYLTSIVGSNLQWIDDEEDKEEIWSQASLRLSERSGRTAMGAISRTFSIPSFLGSFQLKIHEPALTGDNLGLKTWAASFLLAKRLHTSTAIQVNDGRPLKVLELGSGTGLVGMAMAGLGADVVLTDLPSIYPNLALNVQANSKTIEANGGSTRCGVLDWTEPSVCELFSPLGVGEASEKVPLAEKFPLILAADSLYSPEHPCWLVNSITTWLASSPEARVVVEFPLRDAYLPEITDFRARMVASGLVVIKEGEEAGYDDWEAPGVTEDEGDARAVVKCWWCIWGRQRSEPI